MIRPAAFGRLCVETRAISWRRRRQLVQPPSGGCVLKHDSRREALTRMAQPPSGGCVLKLCCELSNLQGDFILFMVSASRDDDEAEVVLTALNCLSEYDLALANEEAA